MAEVQFALERPKEASAQWMVVDAGREDSVGRGKDAGSRLCAGDAIHMCILRWFNTRVGLRLPIRINIGSLL